MTGCDFEQFFREGEIADKDEKYVKYEAVITNNSPNSINCNISSILYEIDTNKAVNMKPHDFCSIYTFKSHKISMSSMLGVKTIIDSLQIEIEFEDNIKRRLWGLPEEYNTTDVEVHEYGLGYISEETVMLYTKLDPDYRYWTLVYDIQVNSPDDITVTLNKEKSELWDGKDPGVWD